MPNQFYTDERGDSRTGDVTHSEVSVGTATTEVAAENPNRRYLLIQNAGANPVFLRFDETPAILNEGFSLAAGDHFEWPRDANNALYRGQVNGIVAAATELVLVSEA